MGTTSVYAMMVSRKLAAFLGFSVLTLAGPAQALPAVSPKHKPVAKPKTGPGGKPLPQAKRSPKVQPKANPTPKAKPASKSKPGASSLPVPKQMLPIQRGTPQLDPKISRALRKPKKLSKGGIVDVARRFGIDATRNDVESTTALSVRRPYHGPGAYMSLEGAREVRPQAHADGHALVDADAELRRVFGTGPATTPAHTPEALARQYDPLHPDFPASAEATVQGPHLGLHVQAAAHRDYVVSCRVKAGQDGVDYGVRVEVDGTYSHMIPALSTESGRISFALPRSNRTRGIDLQIVAGRKRTAQNSPGFGAVVVGQRKVVRFAVSRCDITPVS